MAINDVAGGKGVSCIIYFLNLWVIILCPAFVPKNLKKLSKNLGYSSPDSSAFYAQCV